MAALNVVTVSLFLSVFCLSGDLADCQIPGVNITAPHMEALSGSCVQIPCNFTAEDTFDSTRQMFGVWIKEDPRFDDKPYNIIFNSSGKVLLKTRNKYPMNITGNLSEKNCTTLFYNLLTEYSNKYFFRIENWPFRATSTWHPVDITVEDSPWRPTIQISGEMKEAESVTITCSAPTPCPQAPPRLTWNLSDSHSFTEENTDRTLTTKLQENLTLSHTHDGLTLNCSASYPVFGGNGSKTAETEVTLSVSYAPKDTSASISPSGLVSAGSWVNLSCSSRAKPPVSSFSWFKISQHGATKVSEGDFYSFNVTDSTDGGRYYCEASNDLGSQTSPEIRLTIEGEEPQESSWWRDWIWGAALGGICGIIGLICLIICVWWFKKHQTPQRTQSQTVQLAPRMPAAEREDDAHGEEGIHYEHINFSKKKPERPTTSGQDGGEQEDTVYAQVKVSKPKGLRSQAAGGPEELYAQVKKT